MGEVKTALSSQRMHLRDSARTLTPLSAWLRIGIQGKFYGETKSSRQEQVDRAQGTVRVTHYKLLCRTRNQLTTWSTVLFDKITVVRLLYKLPAFYATRRLITVFTRAT
jgi:hypothetical protein